MTRKYTLTAKALAADRANLAKARAATKKRSALTETKHVSTSRQSFYAKKLPKPHHVSEYAAKHPLGSREVNPTVLQHRLTVRGLTGIPQKFRKRLAPTGYMRRTAWDISRAHHFRKRLRLRKHKPVAIGKWRRNRKHLRVR